MTDRKDTQALATGYTSANSTQFNAALFLISRLNIRPGARILDVGCGPGNLTLHLAQLVGPTGSVIGVDPSTERIRLAQATAATNTSYAVGIAEALSAYADGSFDVVFVNSTLHWVADQRRAVSEFARVLAPGGRLGVSGSHGDFEAAHERIKATVLSREPFAQYKETGGPVFLTRAQMDELLNAAGFGERAFEINEIVKEERDAEAMINWLDTSSSGQTYGGIPLDMRPRAREEMKVEWEKITTEEGIKMPMQLLVTVATKP